MEEREQPHVVSARRNDDVVTARMGFVRFDRLIASLRRRAWSRMSAGAGVHGPREYYGAGIRDWWAWNAHITLSMAAHVWLVVARTLTLKGKPAAVTT